MDIRSFYSRKRTSGTESSSEGYPESELTSDSEKATSSSETTPRKKVCLSQAEKKKVYKASLSFRKEWEKLFPWVACEDPKTGMFCKICCEWGNPPPGSRGAWTSRGITDWNHGKEQLKKHAESQWHKDALVKSTMAKQTESGGSVLDVLSLSAAKDAAELREKCS